jgi:hypothetical protein
MVPKLIVGTTWWTIWLQSIHQVIPSWCALCAYASWWLAVIAHIYKSSLLHFSTLHIKGIFLKWFVWYIVVYMFSNSFQTIHVELVPPHNSVGYLPSFMCSPWANTHVWSMQHMIPSDKTRPKFAQCTFHLWVDPRIRRSTLAHFYSHHVKKLTSKRCMCHTRLYIWVKLSLNYLDETSTIKKTPMCPHGENVSYETAELVHLMHLPLMDHWMWKGRDRMLCLTMANDIFLKWPL